RRLGPRPLGAPLGTTFRRSRYYRHPCARLGKEAFDPQSLSPPGTHRFCLKKGSGLGKNGPAAVQRRGAARSRIASLRRSKTKPRGGAPRGRMLKSYFQGLFADPNGTPALVRRLLLEQAAGLWRRYLLAFGLMGVAGAMTALGAYLIGDVINQAYVHKNLPGIFWLALATAAIFMVKALATYGSSLTMARIGNRIIADNQRRMFARLLQHNVAFFAERHSSEFMARLTTGAAAASQVLNLLFTAIGRDLVSLIGLATVMAVQDPVMSLFSVIVVPPAMLVLRKLIKRIRTIAHHQFTGNTRILETLQETVQGIRIVKAYTLEESMRARFDAYVAELEKESNKWARVAYRSSPLMEGLGGFAIAGALIYGGFRVIETGATPGQFF